MSSVSSGVSEFDVVSLKHHKGEQAVRYQHTKLYSLRPMMESCKDFWGQQRKDSRAVRVPGRSVSENKH